MCGVILKNQLWNSIVKYGPFALGVYSLFNLAWLLVQFGLIFCYEFYEVLVLLVP